LTRDQIDEYYLTVAEVAELLRLNQQTVRNWIDQGSLPALRVGRRVRIKQSDLDRLLSDGYRTGPQAGAPDAGPSAEDFWGGEPVGVAEPADTVDDEAATDAPEVAKLRDVADLRGVADPGDVTGPRHVAEPSNRDDARAASTASSHPAR
jgi:excisionase family DNA binding protein